MLPTNLADFGNVVHCTCGCCTDCSDYVLAEDITVVGLESVVLTDEKGDESSLYVFFDSLPDAIPSQGICVRFSNRNSSECHTQEHCSLYQV